MLCLLCSEGEMSRLCEGAAHAPHLSQVIADFYAISIINLGKFDYHVESSTFLCVAAALRLEIVRKESSDTKRT